MKKILKCMIFSLLLCLGLTIQAFAESGITISEDFNTLTYDNQEYTAIDASILDCGDFYELEKEATLSEEQQKEIKRVLLSENSYKNMLHAEVTFHNGSVFSIDFLKNELVDAYEDAKNGTCKNVIIDFQWPAGNTVSANTNDLLGAPVILDKYQLDWSQYFPVVAQIDGENLLAGVGLLMIVEENYYYVDFVDAGLEPSFYFYPEEYSELSAYKIQNPALVTELQTAEAAYYDDDLGFVENDDFTESVAIVFCSLIFGLLPLVLFIVFLIFGLRSKTIYRRLFLTISALSGSVLIIFGILFFIFMTNV